MKKSTKGGAGADNARDSDAKSPGGKTVGGLRHLFTARAARKGERGGFQTVACSPKLSSLVEAVEELVTGYSAPEAEAPGCRQLLPVPGRGNAYALTTFTPTGLTPDERPGNSWAETVVVPAAWLEQAGWDTAAAFAAIGWQGPRDLASLPEELPPVELPALAAGALSRLEALPRAVPENLLYPLLLAVIQQSHGLRPVRLLEAPGAEPRLLEEVVTLLPLVVPPALRTYRDGEQKRCLTLRTRSPRGGMSPAADVTGFPAAAAAELEQEQGSVVIDLSGGLPAPDLRDGRGEAYARWLVGVLCEGRWGELEERYAEEITGPALGWLAGFRLDQAAARSPAQAAPAPLVAVPEEGFDKVEAAPSVYGIRKAGWQARDEAEAEAWGVLEEQRRQLGETLAGFRQEMADAVARASGRLKEHVAEQQGLVEFEADKALRSRKAHPRRAAADGVLEQRIEDLEADIRALHGKIQTLQGRLEPGGRATPEPVAPARPSATGASQVETPKGKSPVAPLRDRASREWAKARSQHPLTLVWKAGFVLAGLLLLALLLIKTAAWLSPQTPPGSPPAPPGETPAAVVSGEGLPLTPAQRRQALQTRLQQGATAGALLREAAGREGFEERAAALLLVHVLPRTAPLPEGAKVTFLQQALGITVDAGWGRGSSDALESNLPDRCRACRQTEPGWEGAGFLARNGSSASCFLNDSLRLEGPKCDGESPWRPGRSWTEAEATAALALFRATRTSLEDSGRPNRQALAAEIARLDPAAPEGVQLWADLGRTEKLPAAYAGKLLDLAYSLITNDPKAVTAPGDIPEDRLSELEALLDAAVSPGEPGDGEGGGAD